MGIITAIPEGGLCNRLRVVLSGLALARRGFRVCVEWGSTWDCRAEFADLFEPITFEYVAAGKEGVEGSFCIRPRRWWNAPRSRRNLRIPELLRHLYYGAQYRGLQTKDSEKFLSRARAYNNIYVSTCYEWFPYAPELVHRLKPVKPIAAQIDALTSDFDAHTIGVHIRRTDNIRSKERSTDSAFEEAMENAVKADGAARFFVATDELDLLERLKEKFPRRVMHQQLSTVRRDTCEGIQQAVVDLFCLARCSRLIGSYWSSFSEMAAEIGEIELYIVGAPQ